MNQHPRDLHLITMLGRAVLPLILTPSQQLREERCLAVFRREDRHEIWYLHILSEEGTRSAPRGRREVGNRPRHPVHWSARNVSLVDR
jgi:hypothetical protein